MDIHHPCRSSFLLASSAYSSDIVKDVKESGVLGKSQRQFQLFQLLFDKNVDGTVDEISEVMIAMDVMRRGDNFDPASDSIVRAEMHRLRANLASFETKAGYRITIPPASYRLEISGAAGQSKTNEPSVEEPPRNFGANNRYIAVTFALCLTLMLGLLYTSNEQKENELDTPLTETFRAHVRFELSLFDTKSASVIRAYLLSALLGDNMVYFSNSENVDYTVEISAAINDDERAYLVSLMSRTGLIIKSKKVDVADFSSQESLEKLAWSLRYDFVQHPGSALAIDYAEAEWVDKRKQNIQRCLIDTQSLSSEYELSYFELKELPVCLDTQQTEFVPDQAGLKLELAMLSMRQARGYSDYGINDPLALAARLNVEAGKSLTNNRAVFTNKIYYIWTTGVKNISDTELLLDEAKAKFPSDTIINYMSAATYALYLLDWERSEQASASVIAILRKSSKPQAYALLPLAKALVEDDAPEVYFWGARLLNPTKAPGTMWALSSLCAGSSVEGFPYTMDVLVESLKTNHNIVTFAEYDKLIRRYNYHPVITNKILSLAHGCDIFPDVNV